MPAHPTYGAPVTRSHVPPPSLLLPVRLLPQTPVSAAAFAPDGRHAVSCCSSERHVAVWATQPARKPKKSSGAVATLALEHAAVGLDTCEHGTSGGFCVAVVSEAGEAYVFACEPAEGGAAGEPGSLSTRLLARVRIGSKG